jgi:hypothetical protein
VNFGSNGAVSSHSSSGTSRRDRSTLTVQHHAASVHGHVRHPLSTRGSREIQLDPSAVGW